MGRWRNKWENEPKAPRAQNGPDLSAFNARMFDPVNATIEHADKIRIQELARAAASGDPKAVAAYHDELYNKSGAGLTWDERDALAQMFTYQDAGEAERRTKALEAAGRPVPASSGNIKASPQDMPMTPELKQFIENEGQQLGKGYDVTQEPGYIARMQKAQRDGEGSFDHQSGMSPQELEDLKKWYLAQQEQGSSGGYVAQNPKNGKGKVKPTTANETKQAGPVAPPKKSAKERMQEKYGVRPRMAGRGFTEY